MTLNVFPKLTSVSQFIGANSFIPDPNPPGPPPGLIHTFLIVNTNITAKLMWHQPVSDAQVTGYRLVWGQVVPGKQVLDSETALTKVLGQASVNVVISVEN